MGRAPQWHRGGRRFDPGWLHHHARLAQQVERLSYTQDAGGSNPSPGTTFPASAPGRDDQSAGRAAGFVGVRRCGGRPSAEGGRGLHRISVGDDAKDRLFGAGRPAGPSTPVPVGCRGDSPLLGSSSVGSSASLLRRKSPVRARPPQPTLSKTGVALRQGGGRVLSADVQIGSTPIRRTNHAAIVYRKDICPSSRKAGVRIPLAAPTLAPIAQLERAPAF